ncbi:hypothetical protein [Pseudomonas chlororaphis]|uniref:Protein OrgA n=1 Tax=Pseudomonas chlororaphis TaxID=587753 RepID=A0AAX3FT65_9PSED|nr:hypothetical protein [Pseudomonas chlororaphis]AZC38185.1 Oxygen-regulated invasion protein OrgA [Pseudomonas chlororaphis subsp. piscium]AZC44731.1 Oxygen-regulated invasion protein OrgA [Pseudomonas chlororaphis subsp. piscium]WDG70339.1 hypothetical protein PUP65_19700 [Pseudomonas chlororaphis]WDH31875.1 hypothetical protein PUP81_14620 [Pseudomonas chlororaphis]WDH68865.1 hypothetical protein PUP78_19685 [Pseudomonas chlororaphis]
MLHATEALHAILHQPLDYLHPHRGGVPALFEVPAVRALLNQSLLRGLGLSCPHPQQLKRNPWADLWVAHWRHLPVVARLMGAHLMWPQLARGARMRELDAPARAFARIDLGNRPAVAVSEADGLEQSLSALGLAALTAWHQHIPEALMQRLFLQFSPRVVELQQALPVQAPNSSLFILAVQHARIHQNPC